MVLESKGIDVVLGMDWLSKHKVLIDCAKKFVKLTTPDGKELEFVAKLVVTAMGVSDRAKVNKIEVSQGFALPGLMSFPMSSPKSCQVCHLTETSSL
jgi:argonaute-like protein implicated in RNA metabolism and viral defense